MNIFQRVQKAYRAFNSNVNMEDVSKRLDAMIASEELQTGPIENKQVDTSSKLDIRRTEHNLAYASLYYSLRNWVSRGKSVLDGNNFHDPGRDIALAEVWMHEPLLAGTIYSMCAKFSALRWQITGKRLPAKRYAQILASAEHMDGVGWGPYVGSVANDFYTVNRGTFSETAKDGDPTFGKLSGIGHIDALACTLTGNREAPMWYLSDTTGQSLAFHPGEYFHFASLPSPRELDLGAGFCFVERAYKAAKLLMGLHDYDLEKLNNLPPEGVAAVTGLTMDEFQDALALWQAARKKNNALTFPQVLWLIGSEPSTNVSVNITGFSSLPESFDRKTVVDQYACTLALAAGIDVREIWTIASGGGLGSAGESEIQHMKAKGKGPGEFITNMERCINGELPEGVEWGFDTQDIEEDANQAAIAKAWIDAFFPLYNLPPAGQKSAGGVTNPRPTEKANPRPDKPNGQPALPTTPVPGVDTGRDMTNGGGQPNQPQQAEQVLSKQDILRLLVDKGVLPDWLVNDERVMLTDTSVHLSKEGHDDDITTYVYDGVKGILSEKRSAPIVINSSIPVAEISKESQYAGTAILALNCFGIPEINGIMSKLPNDGMDDPHITLVNIGDIADKPLDDLLIVTKRFAEKQAPIQGKFIGFAMFDDKGDGMPLVLLYDSPQLPYMRQSIRDKFMDLVPEQNHGFIPHCTLTYLHEPWKLDLEPFDYTFDKISLWYGGRHYDFPLTGNEILKEIEVVQYLEVRADAILDTELKRNIVGNPIPEKESTRGASVTSKTVRDELERWKKHPILAKYVPTDDELTIVIDKLQESKKVGQQ